jgi:hypothetical protein
MDSYLFARVNEQVVVASTAGDEQIEELVSIEN